MRFGSVVYRIVDASTVSEIAMGSVSRAPTTSPRAYHFTLVFHVSSSPPSPRLPLLKWFKGRFGVTPLTYRLD